MSQWNLGLKHSSKEIGNAIPSISPVIKYHVSTKCDRMCACCLPCSCRIERWRLQCSVSLLPHDYFGSRGCSNTFYCIKPDSNTVLSWAGKLGTQKMEVQWHRVSNACRTTVMNGAVNCCWYCFMHFLIPAYLTAPALLNNTCLFCAHAGTCTRELTQVAIIFTPSSTKFPVKEEINFDYSHIYVAYFLPGNSLTWRARVVNSSLTIISSYKSSNYKT